VPVCAQVDVRVWVCSQNIRGYQMSALTFLALFPGVSLNLELGCSQPSPDPAVFILHSARLQEGRARPSGFRFFVCLFVCLVFCLFVLFVFAFLFSLLFCLSALPACLSPVPCSNHEGQKRASDPLGLESPMSGSYHINAGKGTWVLCFSP